MIRKPELYVSMEHYGNLTKSEYEWLSERLEGIMLESVRNLVNYAYRDGVKDGIEFYGRLDTN